MNTMSRQPLTILLVLLITAQAVMGGVSGVKLLCMGGGHEHTQEIASERCELDCSHESSWPIPQPVENHDGCCGCIDVELAISDMRTPPRFDAGEYPVMIPMPVYTWAAPVLPVADEVRRVPMPSWHVPRREQRLSILSSTRLQI